MPAVSVLVLAVLAVGAGGGARRQAGPGRPPPAADRRPAGHRRLAGRQSAAGRMFNYQAWGSYLEFRLGPRAQVGFDSRIELPPADRWGRYPAVISGHWDAERQLDEWGVGHVVTSRHASPALVDLLEASGRWRLVSRAGTRWSTGGSRAAEGARP